MQGARSFALRVLRLVRSVTVCARRRGRPARDPHPRGARAKPADVREPARPRRAPGARDLRQPQPRDSPDAGREPRCATAQALPGYEHGRERAAGRTEPARPAVPALRAKPELGCRHHVPPRGRRLALPRDRPRPLLALRRRLGDERRARPAARHARARDGSAPAPPGRRPPPPLRPRHPVLERGFPARPRRARDHFAA